MAEFETIRYQVADRLARITLARPEVRNAVNLRMFEELGEAAAAAAGDPAVRAVLVRAEPPSFCAGLDLGTAGELAGLRGEDLRAFIRTAQRPYLLLGTMAKPAVAAVRGHALGAGFQLALACDLRVAAPDARFGMLEARFGLVPDLGGPHRLARLVGPARAKELIWTTRLVDTGEAERLGLVDRVGEEDPTEAAEALCREVATYSPTAAGLAKRLVEAADEVSLEEHLGREAEAQAECLSGEHHAESVAAYVERRPPRFA